MKILLGGIPLGCDNIGDEAIIGCVVRIFKELFPSAELTVCTRMIEKTSRLLDVHCLPLYGFDPTNSLAEFERQVKNFDCYVWAGATGLSDYPAMGCALLEAAHRQKVKTVIWNVGMNDTFNPAFFRLSGSRAKLCGLVKKVFRIDLQTLWESLLIRKIRRRIGRAVSPCDLVVLRDAASLENLLLCDKNIRAVVGADSAMIQEASASPLSWSAEEQQKFASFEKRIGLCISAQSAVREMDHLTAWMDTVCDADPEVLWVMIPMNPLTDYELMAAIAKKMRHQDRWVLTKWIEPEEIQALAGTCKLLISSRLHLIILGLNELVPGIGIGRGSKVKVFLDHFDLPLCGSTEKIDFAQLSGQAALYLHDNSFPNHAKSVRETLLNRLDQAKEQLIRVLE